MVLQTGTCLSLSLRLMKAAAGFPSSDGTRQQLHEVSQGGSEGGGCERGREGGRERVPCLTLTPLLSFLRLSLCWCQETWQKRHSYVETVVWLISQASKKKELHSANYSDAISHLFQTALDLCMQGVHW